MNEVTRILTAIEQGDPTASEQLLPLVYQELRKLAALRLAQDAPAQTLQATALVHEAWLRLIGDGRQELHWNSRGHFFSAAAEAMRRILIDNARRKRGPKQGGDLRRVNLAAAASLAGEPTPPDDLEALDTALAKLAAAAPRKAELVMLRFFAGLTIPDAASVLGISHATAERDWEYARVWLYCDLSGEPPPA